MRILFAYNQSWDKEIADYYRGVVPSHRLFGLAEARRLGHEAVTCPCPKRRSSRLAAPRNWRMYQALVAFHEQRRLDLIVATHESAALPLLALKRAGLLRVPVIVLNVALLHPRNCRGPRRWIWRVLLGAADRVISYASAQLPWLSAVFALRPDRLAFVPFGVDVSYFSPQEAAGTGQGCLAVGTNDGKDFVTLIRALPTGTKLTVVTDADNANIIRAAGPAAGAITILHDVPIAQLKRLYQEAAVHVIPLKEARFSSGQTVLLENMALGKTVIVADVSAVRDYVQSGVTAVLFPPGDWQALRNRLESILRDPGSFAALGRNAAAAVRERFSAEQAARSLVGIGASLSRRSSTPRRAPRQDPVPYTSIS